MNERKRNSGKTKNQVLELYHQGLGVMQIARALNQSPHIVSRIIKGGELIEQFPEIIAKEKQ